jgi:hypothetical protein
VKLIAAVFADFESTALGLPSAVEIELCGRTLLGHALRRLEQVRGLDGRLLVVPAEQQDRASAALAACGMQASIRLLPIEQSFRHRWALVGAGRWWGLSAWRGGVLGLTWFDEYVEPLIVAQIMQSQQAEGVLCLSAHMPALDVSITSNMLAYQRDNTEMAHMTFCMAPPGFAGVILRSRIVAELCEEKALVGVTCAYRPDAPQGDPINRPICFQIDADISRTPLRVTGETQASRELLIQTFNQYGEDASAAEFCKVARATAPYDARQLPAEITLELTTEHPLPQSTLRPPPESITPHSLTDSAKLDTLISSLSGSDDRRLVLGGVGDPLSAPLLADAIQRFRPHVAALALETPLLDLGDVAVELLFTAPVDVLLVQLDANSAATYQNVHGTDRFAVVVENIQRLVTERQNRRSPVPLIVPRLTRCAATLDELEAFFDHWLRQTGWAVIDGYRTWNRARPADSLFPMVPAQRESCRRLAERLVLKADGQAWACDELAGAGIGLGDWTTDSLSQIWLSDRRGALLTAHAKRQWEEFPACNFCDQWHRP